MMFFLFVRKVLHEWMMCEVNSLNLVSFLFSALYDNWDCVYYLIYCWQSILQVICLFLYIKENHGTLMAFQFLSNVCSYLNVSLVFSFVFQIVQMQNFSLYLSHIFNKNKWEVMVCCLLAYHERAMSYLFSCCQKLSKKLSYLK